MDWIAYRKLPIEEQGYIVLHSHTLSRLKSDQVMRLLSKRNLLFVLCCFCLNLGVAIDTITSSQSIKDPGNIVSNGNAFKLGFFSPVNSTNRYIGIWYSNISVFTVVWVANRETPLNDSSRVLTISKDGNLVVLDGKKRDSLDIKCYKFCCCWFLDPLKHNWINLGI